VRPSLQLLLPLFKIRFNSSGSTVAADAIDGFVGASKMGQERENKEEHRDPEQMTDLPARRRYAVATVEQREQGTLPRVRAIEPLEEAVWSPIRQIHRAVAR